MADTGNKIGAQKPKMGDIAKEAKGLEREINDKIKAFKTKYPNGVEIVEGGEYRINLSIDWVAIHEAHQNSLK